MPDWRLTDTICLMAFAVACGVWVSGARDSPLLNADAAQQAAYIQTVLRNEAKRPSVPASAPPNAAGEEAAFAEAYWQRNPGVAADSYFGRNGEIGVGGARLHFDTHGRFEGRIWGLANSGDK